MGIFKRAPAAAVAIVNETDNSALGHVDWARFAALFDPAFYGPDASAAPTNARDQVGPAMIGLTSGVTYLKAIGLGLVGSLAEARAVVRRSFEVRTFTPQNPDRWHDPYQRFLGMLPATGKPGG